MADKGRAGFRSLRSRFLFYFLFLAILSLLLFSVLFAFFLWRQTNQEEENARAELVDQAQEMARDLELALQLGQQLPESPFLANQERVTQLLRLEGKLIDATSVVVDDRGQVVAPKPTPARIQREIDPELLADTEPRSSEANLGRLGDSYVVAVPLNTPDPAYYNLVVAKRLEELQVTPSGVLMRYIIIAGAIALTLSIILALLLSNYVLRPLRRLSQAAWDLAHGDMDRRVEVVGQDEISELSRYFNYMAERIQRSSQLQKDFVANVSHEIRTPLTSIEGFSQALLDDVVEKGEDRERYLRIISDESRRLKRVLSQLLALSRLDEGAWVIHPAPLPISDYIQETGHKLQPLAQEHDVRLVLEAHDNLPVIETDRDALEMVISNLLDNAIKFTPEKGEVVLSADPLPKGGVRLQVRDNGSGIPPEDLEHIFDRFFRVDRSRSQRHGGSGLGLAVCREILNLLGGRISVWSKPGKGTVFTITLPPRTPDLPLEAGTDTS